MLHRILRILCFWKISETRWNLSGICPSRALETLSDVLQDCNPGASPQGHPWACGSNDMFFVVEEIHFTPENWSKGPLNKAPFSSPPTTVCSLPAHSRGSQGTGTSTAHSLAHRTLEPPRPGCVASVCSFISLRPSFLSGKMRIMWGAGGM